MKLLQMRTFRLSLLNSTYINLDLDCMNPYCTCRQVCVVNLFTCTCILVHVYTHSHTFPCTTTIDQEIYTHKKGIIRWYYSIFSLIYHLRGKSCRVYWQRSSTAGTSFECSESFGFFGEGWIPSFTLMPIIYTDVFWLASHSSKPRLKSGLYWLY